MSHCSSQTQLTLKLNDHLHSTDEIFNATCLLKEEVKELDSVQRVVVDFDDSEYHHEHHHDHDHDHDHDHHH